MHGLIAASPTGDWSYGGAILTFAFPVTLFIVVGAALYIVYTKPHLVPGHRYQLQLRATTATAVPETAVKTTAAVLVELLGVHLKNLIPVRTLPSHRYPFRRGDTRIAAS